MPIRFILISFFCLFVPDIRAQVQKPLKGSVITKLDNAWFGNGTFTNIGNNRDTCEAWVRRLKSRKLANDELKNSYGQAKTAYDAVLDTMIADIKNAKNVGEVYRFFVDSKERKTEYKRLSDDADKLCVVFINASIDACMNDNLGAGIIAQFIFNTWIDALVPDIVKKIAEVFRDAVKEYYIKRINSLRFKEWDKIK
jgi:hypothetical protein